MAGSKNLQKTSTSSSGNAQHINGKPPHHIEALQLHNIPGYFLIGCLIISLFFLFKLLQPFFLVLVFAMVLATAFYPLYSVFHRWFNGPRFASFLTCVVVVLVIVLPSIVLISLLATEAVSAYRFLEIQIQSGALDAYFFWEQGNAFFDLKERFLPNLEISIVDFRDQISIAAKKASSFLATQSTNVLTGIAGFTIDFLIFLITLYYFFKDGKNIVQKIVQLSPLPDKYERSLIQKFHEMTNAVLYGTFFTALVQGILGGVGFMLAGINQALLWGTVMGFFSLLPYVGTAIIWLPAAFFLYVSGHAGAAIFLVIWGVIAVGMSDNFLRPYFIGEKANIYPLLTFLSVFGGIIVFGFSGILFGPLIVTLTLTFLEIYRLEYNEVLKKFKQET